MYMKICLVDDVLDVITCAKFQNEILRGYDFTGVEFSMFLLIFYWDLQQCSAIALPVIHAATNLMIGAGRCDHIRSLAHQLN